MNTNTFTEILKIAGRIHNIGQFGKPSNEEMEKAKSEILQLLNND